MAIGVRITSNNLSGKTANVTFLPITGGTTDLGTKTIPFNNLTTEPYGDYQIYVPEYDYTYTVSVSEQYGKNQSYARMGNISGSTTYSIASLNFNDFTSEIIDLGIDSVYWNNSNWYMVNDAGYMLIFYNYGDNNRLVLFTDINFNVLDQYSATTTSYNYDILDGRICTFVDNTNGIMKYYNGVNVYEYTFDPNTETLDINWDWDATCLDNTFIFIVLNTDTNTKYSYRALNNGSVLPIDSWDNTIENRYYGCYYSSNYFYKYVTLSSDDSLVSVTMYDTSGNEYGFPNIAANTYYSWNVRWYGNQSFNIVFWDYQDNTTDYSIFNFNGVTQNVTTTTHVRGGNYANVNVIGDDLYWPRNADVGGIFIILYGETGTFYQGGGYKVGYLDIVYRLENEVDFTTYVYNDTGDTTKTFEMNAYGSNNVQLYTFCSSGDSISSIFFIGSDGVKIIPTNENFKEISGVNYDSFGNRYAIMYFKNSYNDGYLKIVNDGNIVSTGLFNTGDPWGWNFNYQTFSIFDSTQSYYMNNQTTGLTETTQFNSSYDCWSYYVPMYYKRDGNILLFNSNTNFAKVLTKDELKPEFFLPYFNLNYDIVIGRNRILYVYNDNSDNTRINLYNFDGALLSSVLSNVTNWSDAYAGEDRYVVVQNTIDGQVLMTMIYDNGYQQVTIDNQVTNWWNINDYILWD